MPDLITYFAANAPQHLDLEASPPVIIGFDRTPVAFSGAAGLVYLRILSDRVADWTGIPGVTILAQSPCTGPDTPDDVYATLFADAAMTALYDAVYDRTPVEVDDGAGGTVTVTPPERFGQMG
ncbi:hypothetical protein [Antarcticimicrobium sediminis]|uniref:Uncharacterized protein n=1 Tax=Antarcticimicrobium sediminis TaxID=2546227 RepID=A0A4R5ET77_9RHOB|nr:hypothetical protein [Antarcticimicrobium sediminis]TDE37973.1 hypothetical protein E1B25_11150 [Antarcticimicrobium sediminis]